MATLCLFFAFGGFTSTYFVPLANGSLRVAPVVHIHGVLFFSWTLLVLLQTSLVAKRRVALHRSLGLAGISLATAMVIFGSIVNLLSNQERMAAGQSGRAYALGFSGLMAMLAFGVMFALAIRNVKRTDYHKRWMLFATCMLLNAPVGRLYRPVFSPGPPLPLVVFATVDSILVACLLYDWKTLRRPHPVTLAAGGVLVGLQIVRFPFPETALWHATYDALLGLVA
jgi:hypothetical protein